uniref:Uncharacterized protein n=1 Tax=uncultured organism TaxID=155900 RepID=M1QBX4_9ZZZZ|nr:hypothetical protein FLSS-27_0017 [uncultured organism]
MSPEENDGFDPREMERSEEVDIKFQTSDEHRTIYANGVYGGMTSRGDLHMDFVTDHSERPETQSFKINQDGSLGRQVGEKGGDDVIRERQVSVYLKPENAYSIATWMLAKILPPNVEEKHIRKLLEDNFDIG